MNRDDTAKRVVREMIKRLKPDDARLVRDVLREKAPQLLTDEHARHDHGER